MPEVGRGGGDRRDLRAHDSMTATEHVTLATLDGMRERTVTISGISKTFSVTGWRVGYCLASPPLSGAIRKVHDFLTVGAPAPLQEAAATALPSPDEYYRTLADGYRARRDFLVPALEAAGFRTFQPRGAYYVMTDISRFRIPGRCRLRAPPGGGGRESLRCRGRASIPIRLPGGNVCASTLRVDARHTRSGSTAPGTAQSPRRR